jgi:hypothetical protein
VGRWRAAGAFAHHILGAGGIRAGSCSQAASGHRCGPVTPSGAVQLPVNRCQQRMNNRMARWFCSTCSRDGSATSELSRPHAKAPNAAAARHPWPLCQPNAARSGCSGGVDTFNYLLGQWVKHIDGSRGIRVVQGTRQHAGEASSTRREV